MGAKVLIFKRDKTHGYYQNDMKCECVFEFYGEIAHDFVMDNVDVCFEPKGTVVMNPYEFALTSDAGTSRYLINMLEYRAYRDEGRNPSTYTKYDFVYRVRESFFDAMVNAEVYEMWRKYNDFPNEEKLLEEQLTTFKKTIPTLDFEKNYYYIVESI